MKRGTRILSDELAKPEDITFPCSMVVSDYNKKSTFSGLPTIVRHDGKYWIAEGGNEWLYAKEILGVH